GFPTSRPFSAGVPCGHEDPDAPENLVTACVICNQMMGAMRFATLAEARAEICKWRTQDARILGEARATASAIGSGDLAGQRHPPPRSLPAPFTPASGTGSICSDTARWASYRLARDQPRDHQLAPESEASTAVGEGLEGDGSARRKAMGARARARN